MKNILIILTLLPFFTLGQSKISNKTTVDSDSREQLIGSNSNNLETHAETALINDIRNYKSLINYDFYKSDQLSLTTKNDIKIRVFDIQQLNIMLLEVRTLIDFKSQFKAPLDTKN